MGTFHTCYVIDLDAYRGMELASRAGVHIDMDKTRSGKSRRAMLDAE